MRLSGTCAFGLTILVGSAAAAQNSAGVKSVEIDADRKVTFCLSAPKAAEAHVDCLGRQVMTRDPSGVWSVTMGPLEPGIYSYSFVVDENVKVPDAQNAFKKNPGEDLLDVPASPPAPWDETDAPHGSIHVDWYFSRSLGIQRRVHVYTPPMYEGHRRDHYPVLYLLHGSGDDDSNWTNIGCAQRILDNLIAQGKARPMIVVMPYGHVPALPGETRERRAPGEPRDPRRRDRMVARFGADLFQDLMPYINRSYRVLRGVRDTALAGLSMGAIQTQAIGLEHPGRFGWLGMMSGAGLFTTNLDQSLSVLAANPARVNREFPLIFISVGTGDNFQTDSRRVDTWLTQHKIRHVYQEMEGGHEWKVWRHSLAALAPLLFR